MDADVAGADVESDDIEDAVVEGAGVEDAGIEGTVVESAVVEDAVVALDVIEDTIAEGGVAEGVCSCDDSDSTVCCTVTEGFKSSSKNKTLIAWVCAVYSQLAAEMPWLANSEAAGAATLVPRISGKQTSRNALLR